MRRNTHSKDESTNVVVGMQVRTGQAEGQGLRLSHTAVSAQALWPQSPFPL